MAKQRNTNPALGVVPVRPAASPVNLLEAPNVPLPAESNDLMQLGEALRQFIPGITAGIAAFEQKETKAGESAALSADPNTLAAVREKNRADLKEAVKRGDIPAGASPWFVKGMRRQALRISAQEYSQGLTEAWEQSDLKDSEDPQAIQEMVQGFTTEFVKARGLENDPEFQDVFAPLAKQVQGNLAAHHTAYRIQRNEQKVIEQTEQEVNLLLDARALNDQPLEDVVPFIQGLVDDHIKNGADPKVMNQAVLKAIARAAEEQGSFELTRLPMLLKAGSGSLGNTNASKELMLQVQQQIASKQNQANGSGLAAAKAERDAAIQEYENQAVSRLLEDPYADITDLQKQLAALDGGKAAGLINLKNTITLSQNAKDSDEDVSFLLERVHVDGATPAEVMRDAQGRKVSTETLARMLDDARAISKVDTEIRGLGNDYAGAAYSELVGNQFDFTDLEARTARARAAELSIKRQYTSWLRARTDAGEIPDITEAYEQAEKIRVAVLSNPKYAPNPKTVPVDPGASPEAPKPSSAAPAATPAPQDQKAPKALFKSQEDFLQAVTVYQNTPEEARQNSRLAIQAEALGLTPEQFIKAQAAAVRANKPK